MDPPYGIWSLLPPVIAITLAIATRHVVLSLMLGVLAGSFLVSGPDVSETIVDFLENRLWKSFTDGDHLRVFAFTSMMGMMIGVITKCGGMHGVVDRLSTFARTRRRGQLTTWLLGMLIFFDDYANSLLLGNTMRPLTDRLKISRAKLAYLVDSTAAPVAGLALISTWVAGEISAINDGLADITWADGVDVSASSLFLSSIPYRFYVLLALAFVAMIAFLGRDFGPMLRAERDAWRGTTRKKTGPENDTQDSLSPETKTPRRWFNAVIPIAVVLAVTLWLIWETGLAGIDNNDNPTLGEIFCNADSYVALLYGSLAGLLSTVILSLGQRILSVKELQNAARAGGRTVVSALAVLWLAWALSDVTGPVEKDAAKGSNLETGLYLGNLSADALTAEWMPTVVFVVSAFVAFSTGTSWGTMNILMPLAIPATAKLIPGPLSPDDPIMLGVIGGVLAGSIFGDHCSPISDTTVLSSQASGCDLVEHVRTQMPYALIVAGVAILFGTIPIGFGLSAWICLPACIAVLAGSLLFFGKTVEE